MRNLDAIVIGATSATGKDLLFVYWKTLILVQFQSL